MHADAQARSFLIRTFGCQMNEHDSQAIAGLLRSDGMVQTDSTDDANVIVLNTCAIRQNADDRLYGNLGHLKALKERDPTVRLVVAGCLAQKDQGQILERAPWVDVVVGTHALPALLGLIERSRASGPQMDVTEQTEVFPSALPAPGPDAFKAWVSIAPGCDNACTFCIVPFVRGPQRSRPIREIVDQVRMLASSGVVEVTLLGQNVNTFGRDLSDPSSSRRPLFAELLRAIDRIDGIRRIRFTSPHPHDFTEDVVDAMASSPNVCEHIHFPLQSGSDRILRSMRRSYRRERYLSWLDRIRAAIPGIGVTTDIIVGFPGETERDFQDTLEVVDRARFDSAYTFQYSPRLGTRAAAFDGQLPKPVVQERFERLVALQESVSLENARSLVGKAYELLIEGAGRKGRSTQGRTRTNRIVHLGSAHAPGEFVTARITAAAPHHLMGEPAPAAVSV
jgi:tRNA-2-methylthio-N6-dimethylallyladenosine synthase